ncbi:MAG: sensor domain-containing protein [Dehalococcoidia bacterium]
MEYSMVAMRPGTPLPREYETPVAPPARSRLRRFFGITTDGRAWLRMLYLALAFPAGLASFVALVTLIAVGAGMLVTLVGIPLLTLTMYGWCLAADGERLLSNLLLGTRIRRLSFPESGSLWDWSRLKRRLANPLTWKALVFLVLRFPLGTLSLVLICLFALPLSLLAAPVTIAFGDTVDMGPTSFLDEWWQALPFAVAAIPLAVAMLHGLNGFAILNGWLATALLSGGRPTEAAPAVSSAMPPVANAEPAPAASAAIPPVAALSATATPAADDDAPIASEPTPAVLEPASPPAADEPSLEPRLSVDVAMRIVAVEGRRVELTPREFDLIALFVQNPNRPFSRDELLDRIWKHDFEVTDRTIDTHVQRLRKKLGAGAVAIRTVWGVGYRFDPAATEEEPTPGP